MSCADLLSAGLQAPWFTSLSLHHLILGFAVIRQLSISEQVTYPFWASVLLSVK